MTVEARESVSTKEHIKRCCQVVETVALALDHAHENGVIHRDLKPENLMLERDGEIYIIDFGVARFFEDATLTQTGQLVGTPLYMPPEQVTGRIDLDHRTDIYSLGLVLYELLTLAPAINAPTREGLLRKIVTKALPPISWQNKSVPANLENIVHMAAAKDPDERYPNARSFAKDLRRFRENVSVVAPPYRYRLDESEIRAARPSLVTLVCLVLCLVCAWCVWQASYGFFAWAKAQGGHAIELDSALVFAACAAAISVYGCYHGYSWGWWSSVSALSATATFTTYMLVDVLSFGGELMGAYAAVALWSAGRTGYT